MENGKRERLLAYDSKEVAVDRINMLPIEVLGLIISFLTLKEAAAAALVCRRWKTLWTLTANLDFDGSDLYGKVLASYCYESALIEERSNFVRWVEGVIASHRNSHLQVFRIFTDLGPEHTQTIDKWLAYALANKARTLELNLHDSIGSRNVNNRHYDFPYKRGNLPANFKILKQLTLNSVNVAGETLEYFLSNCPLLEGLSVTHSPVLTSLEINRPSPSFKCLDIGLCHALKSLVVRDSDLVTLKYRGMMEKTAILLRNVPSLTHLWLCGPFVNSNLDDVARVFAPVLQQIQFLHLYFISRGRYPTTQDGSPKLSFEMPSLKHLVVSFPYNEHEKMDSLLPFVKLINASPFLERFALELPRFDDCSEGSSSVDVDVDVDVDVNVNVDVDVDADADADVAAIIASFVAARAFNRQIAARAFNRQMVDVRFDRLKEVEFVNYRGTIAQLDFIKLLVGKAAALRSMVIDPSTFAIRPWRRVPVHGFFDDEMLFHGYFDDEMRVRASAEEQLRHIVPHNVALRIL